jgi:hypothetical protein
MIEQLIYALLFASGFIFMVFCFVEYVIWQDKKAANMNTKPQWKATTSKFALIVVKNF